MTNHPQKGRGLARVTHFACATVELEKFRHGTPLSEVNNAVDDLPLLLLYLLQTGSYDIFV